VTEDDHLTIGVNNRKRIENKMFTDDLINVQNSSMERYMKR